MNQDPTDRPSHADSPGTPDAYDYHLPKGRIASRPARPRDSSRLLVLRREPHRIEHRDVADLPELLSPGDLLVVNETRVIPARLFGRLKDGGRKIEILMIREANPGLWHAWIRSLGRLKPGVVIEFDNASATATYLGRQGEAAELLFEGEIFPLLESVGHTPLPPYIERDDDADDRDDYQTIFARTEGAVAAPTAGLHFTEELVASLSSRDVELARILLHVGPGTFRPVRVRDLREHKVEAEYFEVGRDLLRRIEAARERGNRVVALGTTTVRALESAARMPESEDAALSGWTDLTIVPPFEFRMITAMMTNFHLPKSSLLLLVCAFAGREKVLAAYDEAVHSGYRFYSYGDAMLII